jgi:uncharacterized protein (TIGR02118 family)
MISVLILYPKSDDSTFDMEYYTGKHMPMLAEAVGEACQGWGVSQPGAKYHAVGWLMADSQEAFDAAMATHGAGIIGDVPNYTNASPELIVGQVVV